MDSISPSIISQKKLSLFRPDIPIRHIITSHLLLVLSAPLYRLVPATGVSPDTVWAGFSVRALLARMVHPTRNCQGSLPRGRPYSSKCVCYRLFVSLPGAFNLHIHAHKLLLSTTFREPRKTALLLFDCSLALSQYE